MSEPMTTPPLLRVFGRLSLSQWLRIGAERLYVYVSWPGLVGMAFSLAAAGSLLWLHLEQTAAAGPRVTAAADAAHPASMTGSGQIASDLKPMRPLPPVLPSSQDTVDLLKHIKATIQSQGLSWPQAEYRVTPMSDEALATLEIRTTIKGPYPKLRALITELLNKEPALALRELTMTRPNGDTADVEAKIRLAVFLSDGWPPANKEGAR